MKLQHVFLIIFSITSIILTILYAILNIEVDNLLTYTITFSWFGTLFYYLDTK